MTNKSLLNKMTAAKAAENPTAPTLPKEDIKSTLEKGEPKKETEKSELEDKPTQRPKDAKDCEVCNGKGVDTTVDETSLCANCDGSGFVK